MRISTDMTDPGFETGQKLKHQDVRVLLDGAEIPIAEVITADEEESCVIRMAMGPDNTFVAKEDGSPIGVPFYGAVQISVSDRPPPTVDEIKKLAEVFVDTFVSGMAALAERMKDPLRVFSDHVARAELSAEQKADLNTFMAKSIAPKLEELDSIFETYWREIDL